MSTVTIAEIEVAINYWRELEPSNESSYRLSTNARKLATPYALLIFHKRAEMAIAELTQDQIKALAMIPAQVKAKAYSTLDRLAQK